MFCNHLSYFYPPNNCVGIIHNKLELRKFLYNFVRNTTHVMKYYKTNKGYRAQILKRALNYSTFRILGKGLYWLLQIPFSVKTKYANIPIRVTSSWEEEKDDILERLNWLSEKIIVQPEKLIKEMPAILGEEYAGQWAIYCCAMLAHACANISIIYPEQKCKSIESISKLIEITNTPTIRHYDTIKWKEDAILSINGKKSHMTYLSLLAWMISNYKMIGGDDQFDNLFHTICRALNRRMLESKYDLNLLSFPYKPIFLPDMLVAIIALQNYSKLYNGTYQETIDKWILNAKTKWIHRPSGLLKSMLPGASKYKRQRKMKGSFIALNCSYLCLVNEMFALSQYNSMKNKMVHEIEFFGERILGIKEFTNKDPLFQLSGGDSGFTAKGLSAGGTAFALGCATFFEDWEFRSKLLRTAEVIGETVKKRGKRHYRLGDIFLTGEAVALAMRTNIKR